MSFAASLGALLSRNGFALRLGTAETPRSRCREERFLDALAGVVHRTRTLALGRR